MQVKGNANWLLGVLALVLIIAVVKPSAPESSSGPTTTTLPGGVVVKTATNAVLQFSPAQDVSSTTAPTSLAVPYSVCVNGRWTKDAVSGASTTSETVAMGDSVTIIVNNGTTPRNLSATFLTWSPAETGVGGTLPVKQLAVRYLEKTAPTLDIRKSGVSQTSFTSNSGVNTDLEFYAKGAEANTYLENSAVEVFYNTSCYNSVKMTRNVNGQAVELPITGTPATSSGVTKDGAYVQKTYDLQSTLFNYGSTTADVIVDMNSQMTANLCNITFGIVDRPNIVDRYSKCSVLNSQPVDQQNAEVGIEPYYVGIRNA